MFHSEHLQEKWAPLLNYEGLDPIKDSHRRAVTAVLLENQEKFLREQNAFASSGSFLTWKHQPNVNMLLAQMLVSVAVLTLLVLLLVSIQF
jgi:hypothetical protein